MSRELPPQAIESLPPNPAMPYPKDNTVEFRPDRATNRIEGGRGVNTGTPDHRDPEQQHPATVSPCRCGGSFEDHEAGYCCSYYSPPGTNAVREGKPLALPFAESAPPSQEGVVSAVEAIEHLIQKQVQREHTPPDPQLKPQWCQHDQRSTP